MGSIAASGFNLSNLLQSLTSTGSPQFVAALSTSAVQTALKSAPTSDLLDLSAQALKLQESDLPFGSSGAATTATIPAALDPLSSLLGAMEPAAGSATGSLSSNTSSSNASLANQLTGYQGDVESENMQALFGIGPTGPAPSTLFDALG